MLTTIWAFITGAKKSVAAQFLEADLANVPFLAIDLELTSLEANNAEITSIGWIAGCNGKIDLDSAFYCVVDTQQPLGQSPVIHGLTPDVLREGRTVEEAVDYLYDKLSANLLVFHNAPLDLAVLNKVITRLGKPRVNIGFVDTLQMAVYQLKKRHSILPDGSVTLAACRQRLLLPDAPAHNALDDALATLQLWYAQVHELGASGNTCLKTLRHTRAIGQFKLG